MLGSIISAGASLLGGLFGKSSADKARASTEAMANQNIALQREFAQNGIQWRVEDAKKAGIHPIYALGSPGASFSPVSAAFAADTSLPNAMAQAGQDIGRAINTTRSKSDQVYTATAQRLALEKAGLENDVLRMELASKAGRLRASPSPGIPGAVDSNLIPGQGDSPLIKNKPMEVTPSHAAAPNAEPSTIPTIGYGRETTGFSPMPSKDVKERIEDNLIQELMWAYRNNILPSFGFNLQPPPFSPGEGKRWVFNPLKQEYQAQDDRLYRYFRRHDPLPVRPAYKPRRY